MPYQIGPEVGFASKVVCANNTFELIILVVKIIINVITCNYHYL